MLKSVLKSISYGALEVATAGRGVARTVDGDRVRFPARWSRFYPRTYNPAKADFIARHCTTGATVLDAGAHIGLYTVLMARRVGEAGHVIACEPAPDTRAALRRTVALNGCSNVEVLAAAISAKSGEGVLHLAGGPCSNANSLVPGERPQNGVTVETKSIDEILSPCDGPVALLKLDIEGSELDALYGAQETLDHHHPAIALEVHPHAMPESSLAVLWDLLTAKKYQLTVPGRQVQRDWFCAQDECFEIVAV